jgi:hypothetical protein
MRGCARVYGFPILFYFIFYARSHALSRERRSGSRTSRSSPAVDLRPKRNHKKEKRTARAVCMGAATSLRMSRTTVFGFHFYFGFFMYVRSTRAPTDGQSPITYLMGGSLVEQLPRSTRRVVFLYPTPAQFLVAAHPAATQRTGTAWVLVVELGPAPPRCCPSGERRWSSVRAHIQAGPRFTRCPLAPLSSSAGGGARPSGGEGMLGWRCY